MLMARAWFTALSSARSTRPVRVSCADARSPGAGTRSVAGAQETALAMQSYSDDCRTGFVTQ
jgi:hypothetical protein